MRCNSKRRLVAESVLLPPSLAAAAQRRPILLRQNRSSVSLSFSLSDVSCLMFQFSSLVRRSLAPMGNDKSACASVQFRALLCSPAFRHIIVHKRRADLHHAVAGTSQSLLSHRTLCLLCASVSFQSTPATETADTLGSSSGKSIIACASCARAIRRTAARTLAELSSYTTFSRRLALNEP